jgi:hypothetical protein
MNFVQWVDSLDSSERPTVLVIGKETDPSINRMAIVSLNYCSYVDGRDIARPKCQFRHYRCLSSGRISGSFNCSHNKFGIILFQSLG